MKNMNGERIRIDVKDNELSNPFDNSKSLNAIQNCIVDFIDNYNSKNYTIGVDFSFYIIYHSFRDLYSGNEYIFGQDNLKIENKGKLPIIHLTLFDIFDPPVFYSGNNIIKLPEVKRYKKIVDSSIWNYYVPVEFVKDSHGNYSTKKEIDFKRFYHVLKEVAHNTAKGLYALSVAEEYADLNARLLEQSHLKGSHKAISPFIFHSENELQTLIRDEFEERLGLENESIVSQIKNHKWRILLVDDKAEGGMSIINNKIITSKDDTYDLPLNSKLSIIISLLEEHFVDSGHTICIKGRSFPDNCIFYIDYVKDIDSAKEALKGKEYDLILLDYLLDNHEYGYELLDDIYYHIQLRQVINDLKTFVKSLQMRYNNIHGSEANTSSHDSDSRLLREVQCNNELLLFVKRYKKLNGIYNNLKNNYETGGLGLFLEELEKELRDYRIGPCDRFFFMFISAYSSAVHERLLAEGLNQSEKYWHINVGACPTNTPQLFLYNLIKLMDKRLNDSHISKLSVDGIVDILGKIYNQKGVIRKKAGDHYQDVQSYQYYYRTILKDYKVSLNNKSIFDTEGSVLMTDFMNKNINLGGLLEHMAQLVHLTAFGTVRQWAEMWEEYVYFKSHMASQIKDKNKTEFTKLCGSIESYIRSLKNSAL